MTKKLKCIQLTGDHGASKFPKRKAARPHCVVGPKRSKSTKLLGGEFLLAIKQTFYFDMKDGVPVRDRIGMQFLFDAEAITYSKELAERFRHERTYDEPDLAISVVNEAGHEIHRELVFPADLHINPRQKSG